MEHIAQAVQIWVLDYKALYTPADRPQPLPGGAPRVVVDRGLRVVALASGGAALIHADVCPSHFAESALFGAFFLVLWVAQLGWSMQVLRRPSAALLATGAAINAATIALWLYTRTIGLPFGLEAGHPEAWGGRDVAASFLEVMVVLAAVWEARRRHAAVIPTAAAWS